MTVNIYGQQIVVASIWNHEKGIKGYLFMIQQTKVGNFYLYISLS